MRVIDCHCHTGEGRGPDTRGERPGALGRYLRRAQEAGISCTVLFASFSPDYAVANREVARLVASVPGRFIGFAFVHAARDRGRVFEMVREAVQHHGFRGIKVHRHDARITREVCEVARLFGVPVLYDVMGETEAVGPLASEYPEVDFIIPHLGSFADDGQAQRGLMEPLAQLPNVYADTAGVRRFDMLEEAVARAGPRKLLFGSDGPWLHPGLELAKVRALRLPAPEERRVVGGTLRRLLRKRRRVPAGLRPALSARAGEPLEGELGPWEGDAPAREAALC